MFFYNIMVVSINNIYLKDREKNTLASANIISGNIAKSNFLFDETKKPLFDQELSDKSKEGSFRIIVLDAMGVIVNDTNLSEIGKTLLLPEVVAAMEKNSKVSTHIEEKTIYATTSIINDTSDKIGVVLIVTPIDDILNSVDKIKNTIFVFIVVAMLILVVLVFFISRFLLEPIINFLKVVQKMADGHLNERIKIKGRDEFSRLGIAFNSMAEKLEKSEKTREEFVSNVSHDLKTPLSSIKVLTESILLQENVPEEIYKEFLQDINSEIDRMTYILNDLLNLVKLDQREIAADFKITELNEMCKEIVKRLSPLAKQKNIDLLCEETKKVSIKADEMKLNLAISNLVENAIKYTGNNGLVVVALDADHQNAFITVKDTGIGMSEDEIPKIFTRFYRVDKTRDRETGGTGLGLAITHATILLHDGSIKVTSKENEGSSFIIRLPIPKNDKN